MTEAENEVGRLVEEEVRNDGEKLSSTVEGDVEDNIDELEEGSGQEEDGRVTRGGGMATDLVFFCFIVNLNCH